VPPIIALCRCAAAALLLLTVAACSSQSSNSGVGTVDIARITSHWTKFSDYEHQLTSESQRISASRESDDTRRAQLDALHTKYEALQSDITTQVRQAADKVAQAQGLHLIVTREFVGYGGRDVTSDVENALGVVETPSPAPTTSTAGK
jgi:Skp family chaperone for outer membrane proteins